MTFFCEQDFDARDYKGLALRYQQLNPQNTQTLKKSVVFVSTAYMFLECLHFDQKKTQSPELFYGDISHSD
tara:strand:+ start:1696 stop:1908 length:213 start_codon:yes stop_codon:yes gene_type:complete